MKDNSVINNDNISRALKYYKIVDEQYANKCYDAANVIIKNPEYYKNFLKVYNMLFVKKISRVKLLWKYKNIKDLFNFEIHFVTNIILLSGYKVHQENMEKSNFEDIQINIHKKRVKECLENDIYNRNYDSIRISQMLWGVYFINVKLIEVGRLQYELCQSNINIHIPRGGKLLYNDVIKSINDSKYYINKYFNLNDYHVYCNSWLLSLNLKSILNDSSNIIKFQSLFDIKRGDSCINDILNFVYQIKYDSDYNKLTENTNLQKKIKEYLLQGNDIKLGMGVLKDYYLTRRNRI